MQITRGKSATLKDQARALRAARRDLFFACLVPPCNGHSADSEFFPRQKKNGKKKKTEKKMSLLIYLVVSGVGEGRGG